MRIRQVKPDFWRDVRLADLNDTDRLVYVGLWMEADDAGWFREDVAEIATDLYPYQPRAVREKRVASALDRLHDAGRIKREPCGHSQVPTLPRHQRLSAPEKQVRTTLREHQSTCIPAETRGNLPGAADIPHTPGTERNGKGREGTERNGGVQGGGPMGSTNGSRNWTTKRGDDGLTRIDGSSGRKDRKKAEDEEAIDRNRAILDDPAAPEWKKEAARTQLGFLGVTA